MSILSTWMAKDRANRAFVMSLSVLTAINVGAVATKIHSDKKEHPVELAKIAVALDKSNSLAQEQIKMLPSHYSHLSTLVRQGRVDEARRYSQDLVKHLKTVRQILPPSLEHGITMAMDVDKSEIDLKDAFKAMEPALKSKNIAKIESAAVKLFAAIEGKDDVDLIADENPLPLLGI